MSPWIVSIVYTTFATGMAFITAPKGNYGLIRIAIFWVFAGAVAFTISSKAIAFLIIAAGMLALAPIKAPGRIFLYIACYAALPNYFDVLVPFPGINYLIDLDFGTFITLVLLGPIFVNVVFQKTPQELKTVDWALLLYVFISGVMSIRDLPFTSMLRETFYQFVLIYVPYISISRSITTSEDADKALKALFVGVVIVSVIAMVSSFVDWNYYADLGVGLMPKIYADYRGGFLRIYSTLVPPLVALVAGAGVVLAMYQRSARAQSFFVFLVLFPIFAFAAFVTGSRGGQISALIIIGLYLFLPRLRGLSRRLLSIISSIMLVVIIVTILRGDVIFRDPYGTFQYRVQLMQTSFEQIAKKPLFGSAVFRSLPAFQPLRQGEGIIDIVNSYLDIALKYGLVGLSLYLVAVIHPIFRGFRQLAQIDRYTPRDPPLAVMTKRPLSVLLGVHFGFLAMIATTSGISYVWNFGFIILAMLIAQIRVTAAILEKPLVRGRVVEEPDDDLSPTTDAPASGQGRQRTTPYGVRHFARNKLAE